ncbi:DUF2514 family protein [Pseudomonas sp. ML96]|uniref:DUF2514 family protein n=1 Tax=Pseudomonas sp. ML96 TaxID=1523503 RepID=UPI00068E4961|nr:DUF2514 family protein [Pseudomonas sp. ML96]
MVAWLKLVPAWAWLAIVLGLWTAVEELRLANLRSDLATEQAAHSSYRTDVAERDRRAALAALAETKRRQGAAEEIEKNAQEKLAADQGDAARAGDALQRLQQRYAEAEQRARQCGNTITDQLSAAAEAGARMRAELLGRLGAAAGLYAATADDNRVRGQACEDSYESLTPN